MEALKTFAVGLVTLAIGLSVIGGVIWLMVHHPVPFGWAAAAVFFGAACMVVGDAVRHCR